MMLFISECLSSRAEISLILLVSLGAFLSCFSLALSAFDFTFGVVIEVNTSPPPWFQTLFLGLK